MPSRCRTLLALCAVTLTAGCAGPDGARLSPFRLWGLPLGMRLDALQQFFIRQDNIPWGRCDTLALGLRRCSRYVSFPQGNFEALADPQGRVVRMRLDIMDHDGGDLIFDEQLSVMERGWFRVKGMRVDTGGVSDAHPVGTVVFATARGRWTAAVTFDGHKCFGASRACPVRVELVDHRAPVDVVP
jgi:hypothetical protein